MSFRLMFLVDVVMCAFITTGTMVKPRTFFLTAHNYYDIQTKTKNVLYFDVLIAKLMAIEIIAVYAPHSVVNKCK